MKLNEMKNAQIAADKKLGENNMSMFDVINYHFDDVINRLKNEGADIKLTTYNEDTEGHVVYTEHYLSDVEEEKQLLPLIKTHVEKLLGHSIEKGCYVPKCYCKNRSFDTWDDIVLNLSLITADDVNKYPELIARNILSATCPILSRANIVTAA